MVSIMIQSPDNSSTPFVHLTKQRINPLPAVLINKSLWFRLSTTCLRVHPRAPTAAGTAASQLFRTISSLYICRPCPQLYRDMAYLRWTSEVQSRTTNTHQKQYQRTSTLFTPFLCPVATDFHLSPFSTREDYFNNLSLCYVKGPYSLAFNVAFTEYALLALERCPCLRPFAVFAFFPLNVNISAVGYTHTLSVDGDICLVHVYPSECVKRFSCRVTIPRYHYNYEILM